MNIKIKKITFVFISLVVLLCGCKNDLSEYGNSELMKMAGKKVGAHKTGNSSESKSVNTSGISDNISEISQDLTGDNIQEYTDVDIETTIVSDGAEGLTEQLKNLFIDMNYKYKDLEIIREMADDNEERYRVVYNNEKTAGDETDSVSIFLSEYINFCKKAYTIENIGNITFYVFDEFTDMRGNQMTEKAMVIDMRKSMFTKYNWENLEYGYIYDTFKNDAEILDVHSAIMKNVDTSKVVYSPE